MSTATKPYVMHEKTIDMGGYTVDRPPGEDWKAVVTANEQKIVFSRKTTDKDGNILSMKDILVRVQWAKDESIWKMSEQEVAKEYFDKERMGLNYIAFSENLKIDEDTEKTLYIDNKKLYNVYFKQTLIKGDLTMIVEQSMYLYFPPGYTNDDKFLVFLVTESYKPEKNELADLSVILPVIKSLQIDPGKLNE